ncbi:high affinity cAMP-specific 3',5'-cyclic phosphodiesterase 7A-like isoform X2 [Gigantopelta aegis]|uniref:high affinity cAMP-specific 3',5'-cyclic phosphodiesterase 7A-like isoform X2 n=1 Tax=Gigantopelta aegis TaxID=1735272 RepID=UPI001B88836F|nr:high affinity cAMP-specific 3',5'-cyclic phosphodiesterase 7A-like isoform X2 [Gigantopelta aegis]
MIPFTTCICFRRNRTGAMGWKLIRGDLTFGSLESDGPAHKDVVVCERRGGISFEKSDKNAIYVRTLGDVKMRTKPESTAAQMTSARTAILESERRLLDKLTSPDYHLHFRSRFLSLHKVHRRRRTCWKQKAESQCLLDEHYDRQAQCLLSQLGNWDFNIFTLNTLTSGRPLFHVALHLFQEYDLIRRFHLDTLKLMKCFTLIEDGYHQNNPYHNSVHAADVTQAMHCYLQEKKLKKSMLPFEVLVAFLASMSHDLDHPGVNNAFLIATANHLATLYQNMSVLENHHWRSLVGVLHETQVLDHLSKPDWKTMEHQLKSLILATDIIRQQEFMHRFKHLLSDADFDPSTNAEHRHFILQIALKCADICNPCRTWKISKVWSEKVCEEFFNQGDTEWAIDIPVTPVCDKQSTTVAKIQAGFMEFVVNPLFLEWQRFNPTELSRKMLDNVEKNKNNWKKIIEEESVQNHVTESDSFSSKFEGDNPPLEEESHEGNNDDDDDGESSLSEGKSEADDVVENDVNLNFIYTEEQQSESGRSLSPVSEDSETIPVCGGSRRHSVPPSLFRRDLNFYLGIRHDSVPKIPYMRRQSLPTTAIYRTTSGDRHASERSRDSRSLSMDTLVARPKLSNLSPSMEASRCASGMDHLNFDSLKNQTLVLQRGSITKYSSQRNVNSVSDLTFHPLQLHLEDDFRQLLQQRQGCDNDRQLPNVGLASSWPTITPKSKIINNGIPGMKTALAQMKPGSSKGDTLECNSPGDKPVCLSEPQRDPGPGRPH